MSLPKEHPFLKYPRTPESRNLEFFILLKIMLGKESNIPKRLLHKCNAVEDGKFSHMKYLEGIDETLILYYIYYKLDIENPIIRINTAFKGCSSLEKISVLPRIYHN